MLTGADLAILKLIKEGQVVRLKWLIQTLHEFRFICFNFGQYFLNISFNSKQISSNSLNLWLRLCSSSSFFLSWTTTFTINHIFKAPHKFTHQLLQQNFSQFISSRTNRRIFLIYFVSITYCCWWLLYIHTGFRTQLVSSSALTHNNVIVVWTDIGRLITIVSLRISFYRLWTRSILIITIVWSTTINRLVTSWTLQTHWPS